MNRRILNGCSALWSIGLAIGTFAIGSLGSSPSFAETDAADNSGSIAEVVITARKKSENLQDVPLAVTALSSQQLENAGARDLRDILGQTAGVSLYGTGSEAYETPVIRGQFNLNNNPLSDGQPNVAVFLDGVYLQNPNSVSLNLLGLERVEVVKGPVSALYGRNGFAGAINYVSKLPGDNFSADGDIAFGDYGTKTLSAYVSGPVAPGLLRVGFGYGYQNSDGAYKDNVSGVSVGGFEKKDLKFMFDATPIDNLEISGGYYYGDDHFDQDALVSGTPNCLGGSYYCGKFIANPLQAGAIPSSSGNTGNNRDVQAGHVKVAYDLKFADLDYLGGYNHVTSRSYEDFVGLRNGLTFALNPGPGTANVFELFGGDVNTEDSSHEIRLASKQNQALRWTAGADYFQSRSSDTTLIGEDGAQIPAGQSISSPANFFLAGLFVTPTGGPSTTNFTKGDISERTYSAFAGVEYDILADLTVNGEFRETGDRQSLDIQYNSFTGPVFRPYGLIPSSSWVYGNYRTGINYKFTEDTLFYFSAATGTKSGGYNTQSQLPSNQTYQPEKNITYEVGAKTEFLNRKLQIDADVYHIDSSNLQLYFPTSNGINEVISNIGGTSNTGFEISSIAKPFDGLTLNASFAYTDPTFTSNSYDSVDEAVCAALPSCQGRIVSLQQGNASVKLASLNGLLLPNASKYTVNLAADYRQMVYGDYEGFAHIDYRYQSKQYTSIDLLDNSYTSPRNLLNLRLGVRQGAYSLALYVQNALDDKTPLGVAKDTELNNLSARFLGSLPSPVTLGGELTIHY